MTTAVAAESLLARAAGAMGVDRFRGKVRSASIVEQRSDRFQADRMYAPTPFGVSPAITMIADWESGVGGSLQVPRPAADGSPARPVLRQLGAAARMMDPWMVIWDWQHGPAARAGQECLYRDYWRTVLTRPSKANGEERLYIDTKSGFPVKIERQEQDALLGGRLVEILWTTWLRVDEAAVPRSAFRMADGELTSAWTYSDVKALPRDSVADLLVPSTSTAPPPAAPPAWSQPDTTRVSPTTFVLRTPVYNNVVTLQRDTIFVFDAQWNEARARADSVWIGKLFPGRHPVRLIVTDIAWPHISGVRYWVANGTPIYTHRISHDFLTEVISRKWTLEPDLLEQRRKQVRATVHTVSERLTLAGGAIEIRAIDGIGSEGGLMVYLPEEKFLYVGDYIQSGSFGPLRPGVIRLNYLEEVMSAVSRNGFDPVTFAAMHVKPTPWSTAVDASRH